MLGMPSPYYIQYGLQIRKTLATNFQGVSFCQNTFLDESSSNFLISEGGPEPLGCNNFHLEKESF